MVISGGFRILNVGTPEFLADLRSIEARYLNDADRTRVDRYLREADRRRAIGSIVLQKDYIAELAASAPGVYEIASDSKISGKKSAPCGPICGPICGPHRDLRHISITYSDYGKPGFGDAVYNVSHDCDVVVIAWCSEPTAPTGATSERKVEQRRVGVDTMKRKSVDPATFAECFTDSEMLSIARDPDLFWEYWCAKEALSKAVGIGLGIDFRSLEYDSHRRKIRYRGFDYAVDVFEHHIETAVAGDSAGSAGSADLAEAHDRSGVVDRYLFAIVAM
jgi:hypothetical protein